GKDGDVERRRRTASGRLLVKQTIVQARRCHCVGTWAFPQQSARRAPQEGGRGVTEHFQSCTKKGRGMGRRSLELIEAMYAAAEVAQPITGRGIGYKLFARGLIPSMANAEMQRVYRLLRLAREQGDIPWEWIVDETRTIERVSTWDDPAQYARCV